MALFFSWLIGDTHAGAVAPESGARRPLRRSLQAVARRAKDAVELVAPPSSSSAPLEQCLHVAVLCLTTKSALESVRTDQWSALRNTVRGRSYYSLRDRRRYAQPSPPYLANDPHRRPCPRQRKADDTLGAQIFKQRSRAAKVGNLLGTGYTPRIVFLAGMMLRSLQLSTKLR